jgi:GAF domain-containing protein
VTTNQQTDSPDAVDEPGPLVVEFALLAQRLLSAATVAEVLQRVVEVGGVVVPGADLVSVTLRAHGGRFETPVSTDALATSLDHLQYQLDEGPCVEATRTPGLGITASAEVGAGREFPRWGPAAAAAGIGSVLAVGLFPARGDERVGALNFYSFVPGGLDAADRDMALILAAHASTALAATEASTEAELEKAHLRTALSSRDVIGQAKGILMERRGVDAAEAFQILRKASQSLNVRLVEIATTLAGRRGDL